jgi:hypothetical protein
MVRPKARQLTRPNRRNIIRETKVLEIIAYSSA